MGQDGRRADSSEVGLPRPVLGQSVRNPCTVRQVLALTTGCHAQEEGTTQGLSYPPPGLSARHRTAGRREWARVPAPGLQSFLLLLQMRQVPRVACPPRAVAAVAGATWAVP